MLYLAQIHQAKIMEAVIVITIFKEEILWVLDRLLRETNRLSHQMISLLRLDTMHEWKLCKIWKMNIKDALVRPHWGKIWQKKW